MLFVKSVVFRAGNFFRAYVDRLSPDFDLYVGVSLEVVVPVGVSVGSTLGGEYEIAVAVLEIHYRVSPGFAGAGAGVID